MADVDAALSGQPGECLELASRAAIEQALDDILSRRTTFEDWDLVLGHNSATYSRHRLSGRKLSAAVEAVGAVKTLLADMSDRAGKQHDRWVRSSEFKTEAFVWCAVVTPRLRGSGKTL
jgi:hypothetical protein